MGKAAQVLCSIGKICCLCLLALTTGCGSFVKYEKGAIWCNAPLKYAPGEHFDKRHLEVARRGYIYVLAASWVLQQSDNESKEHWFELPARMKPVDEPARDESGFEVKTFELKEDAQDKVPAEVVIAFVGSNDRDDWVWTNLFSSRKQFELAREYVKKIAARYPSTKLVVTGFSLGGALSAHVTKHETTKGLVSEAWLFNPSPKFYGPGTYDKRIWVGALRGEFLRYVRSRPMELLWPGVERIGAPWQQNAEDYYLISAFPIYGHFRWALARNVLFVADYAHLQHSTGPVNKTRAREPREIIEASYFKACEKEAAWRNRILEGRKAEQDLAAEKARLQEVSATGAAD
jgi:hypothetical protein